MTYVPLEVAQTASEASTRSAKLQGKIEALLQRCKQLEAVVAEKSKEASFLKQENERLTAELDAGNADSINDVEVSVKQHVIDELRVALCERTQDIDELKTRNIQLGMELDDAHAHRDQLIEEVFSQQTVRELEITEMKKLVETAQEDLQLVIERYHEIKQSNEELKFQLRESPKTCENERLKLEHENCTNHNELLHVENQLLKAELTQARLALRLLQSEPTTASDGGGSETSRNEQLAKHIERLRKALQGFASIEKQDANVDEEAVAMLLEKYGAACHGGKLSKLVVSAALQRLVLETVMEQSDELFDQVAQWEREVKREKDKSRERRVCTSHAAVQAVTIFTAENSGHVVTPAQLRNVAYASLASRLFDRLDCVIDDVLAAMDRYRTLRMSNAQDLRNQAGDIVRLALELYAFPFAGGSPLLEFSFHPSGTAFDEREMDARIADINDTAEVELCYFPMIRECGEDGAILCKSIVRIYNRDETKKVPPVQGD